MDPWGTPHEIGADDEETFPKFTEQILFSK